MNTILQFLGEISIHSHIFSSVKPQQILEFWISIMIHCAAKPPLVKRTTDEFLWYTVADWDGQYKCKSWVYHIRSKGVSKETDSLECAVLCLEN